MFSLAVSELLLLLVLVLVLVLVLQPSGVLELGFVKTKNTRSCSTVSVDVGALRRGLRGQESPGALNKQRTNKRLWGNVGLRMRLAAWDRTGWPEQLGFNWSRRWATLPVTHWAAASLTEVGNDSPPDSLVRWPSVSH